MVRIITFFVLFFGFCISASAQIPDSLIKKVKFLYQDFEFEAAIKQAQEALTLSESHDDPEARNLLSLIGISYYNLWKEDSSKIYFDRIFELDSNYKLDSSTVSPKIVSFYNDQRNLFLLNKRINDQVAGQSREAAIPLREVQKIQNPLARTSDKEGILRSILFPGFGQIQQNSNTKGWTFFTLGLLSLGSSIYFIIDSNNKEKQYHNEIDQTAINQTYSKYNSSYQLKNASISIYLGTWLVNLYDIFYN